MKKRILALLMSAALSAGITGCSGDNGPSGAQPQESVNGSSVPTVEAQQPALLQLGALILRIPVHLHPGGIRTWHRQALRDR